jgi:hypothetical protein
MADINEVVAANPRATLEAAGDCREMPSPPHPRLRNRHSHARAVSNGGPPWDYLARKLWTAIPCDSLECRRVVPTSRVADSGRWLGQSMQARYQELETLKRSQSAD